VLLPGLLANVVDDAVGHPRLLIMILLSTADMAVVVSVVFVFSVALAFVLAKYQTCRHLSQPCSQVQYNVEGDNDKVSPIQLIWHYELLCINTNASLLSSI
jgi:hypothetical protein